MKRFLILVILVLTLSLTLFGCVKKKEALPTGYPVEFNGVTVEKKPQRVVSLSKSVTEKLVVLGYKNSIVGDGGSFAEPNFPKLEEISALSPEMVISGGELSPDFKGKLADMGIKTLVIPYTEDKEELYRLWGGLARIFEGSITGELRERQLRYFGESYDKY
ncbi:MAG: hypothetical protein RRY40_03430, partial [Oscillospiraceae bacterium]